MDDWQKIHIGKNLVKLIRTTNCNDELLSILKAVNVISMEDVNKMQCSSSNEMEKAKMLYDVLVTHKGAYELLCQALEETNQTAAWDILAVEKGDDSGLPVSEENSLVKDVNRRFEKTVNIGTNVNSNYKTTFGNSKVHTDEVMPGSVSRGKELKLHWQKFVFIWKIEELVKTTTFCDGFLQTLRNDGALSNFYFNKTIRFRKQQETEEFFRLPFANSNYYDAIMKALRETGQFASLAILEDGYRKMEKWNHPDTRLSSTDFYSLVEAIGFNCDVSLLINHFDTLPDKSLLFQTDAHGFTLLHVAAQCGHIEILKYLISKGLDVNAKTKANETPLHFLGAYGGNAVAVTQILLENGADPYAKNSDNNNVAHTTGFYTSTSEYYDWVEFMVRAGHSKLFYEKGCYDLTPLHTIVLNSEVSKATLNLVSSEVKFNLNSPDKHGETVLMLAALGGQGRDLLECIINLGGNWTKKCNASKSVLHYAVHGGNHEAVGYFISLGADPNDRDNGRSTPIHYLCHSFINQIEITKVLMEHKADLYARDKNGDNVAHLFGREATKKEDYLVWKNYLMSIGQESLFKEMNSQNELPL